MCLRVLHLLMWLVRVVVNERLNHTATKKDLQSLREALRRSEDDGMKEDGGEDDGLVGAALDFSDYSSDEELALPPRHAGGK